MRYSLWENEEPLNSGQGVGWPWGTTTRWPSSCSSVSWVGSAGYSRGQGGRQGHSLVLDLTRKFGSTPHAVCFWHRVCGLIPTSPTPKSLCRLGLPPGLPCPVAPPGEHPPTLQCEMTPSFEAPWIPRNGLSDGTVKCRSEGPRCLCPCTAPSLGAAPAGAPGPCPSPTAMGRPELLLRPGTHQALCGLGQ